MALDDRINPKRDFTFFFGPDAAREIIRAGPVRHYDGTAVDLSTWYNVEMAVWDRAADSAYRDHQLGAAIPVYQKDADGYCWFDSNALSSWYWALSLQLPFGAFPCEIYGQPEATDANQLLMAGQMYLRIL